MATLTYDSKGSNSLTRDTRSSAGTLTNDTHSFQGITWGDDFNTWAAELRTWGEVTSQLTLDTRN